MMFSARTNWNLEENEFTAKVRAAREKRPLLDLTGSNPTHCGFQYDPALLSPLSSEGAREYEPHPLGMERAREAVAAYYSDHGTEIAPGRICLTTSTSEAYSFLFRLLCDPGDEVLIARPSYPLFDYIAGLDGVVTREFPLHHDLSAETATGHAWATDFDALRARIGDRTRAVILVHPNNPTGSFVSADERAELDALCAERGLALIVDEVFLDYALFGGNDGARSFACGEMASLCFVLSGISKVCGLPQMKASWIAVRGPEKLVAGALERLEVIADTFLSMNAPVQYALPKWLAGRHAFQRQVRERMRANVAALDVRLRGSAGQRLALEGGWTAVLRVPREVEGVPFAEAALERGVIVQPGEFYGFPAGRVVLSLLTPEELWRKGIELLPVE